MPKKNKKVSTPQKPFWILSRRAVFGWVAIILFICGWMFAIGVIVGRDDLPEGFDINPLQKELDALKAEPNDDGGGRPSKNPGGEAGKSDPDFSGTLPEAQEDARIAAKPQPAVPKPEIKPRPPPEKKGQAPSGSNAAPKIKRSLKRLTKVRPKPERAGRKAIETKDPATSPASVSKSQAGGAAKPYTIQVASYKQAGDADALVSKLREKEISAYRAIGKVPGKGIWYRVRVGEFNGKTDAGKLMAKLRKLGYKPALVEK